MIEKSLFWEFYTSENPTPSLIYGTIHLSSPQCLQHWDRVSHFIDAFDTIYTESSLDESAATYIQSFTLLDEGVRYQDYVTERRWEKMRKTFIKYCNVDIDLMKMFRPLFILTQLQISLMKGDRGPALDHLIWRYGLNHDKRVDGLESPQEQVEILKSLDLQSQYRQMVGMSKKISGSGKMLSKLLKAYEDQDIMKMYKLSKATLGKDRKLLLKDRNIILSERMMRKHNECSSFFSFGAGHLAGGVGVLRLLKSAGASVKPV